MGTKCFKVVLTQELVVLAILKGGVQKVNHLKGDGGHDKFYPFLRGETQIIQILNFPIL